MGGHECDDLLHQLADLLHGELPPDRSADLHQHLADCPPCMETADFQAQLRQIVAKRCCEEVPDAFRLRIELLLRSGVTDAAGGSQAEPGIS